MISSSACQPAPRADMLTHDREPRSDTAQTTELQPRHATSSTAVRVVEEQPPATQPTSTTSAPLPSALLPSARRACTWDDEYGRSLEAQYERTWSEMLKHSVVVDIDHDGLDDRVVTLGACGNWGDCIHVVLLGCSDDRYHAVWGPEYAQAIGVLPSSAGQWSKLVLPERGTDAGCDPSYATLFEAAAANDTPEGVRWINTETCGLAERMDIWGSDYCQLPPTCPAGSVLETFQKNQ